eukprot:CAMPEP_0178418814 /NCGR_PEP_ID=MMETSP0689_2-20121128/25284_1 /TAXON_ID=160604 /ORGANISM="Amphidinium massartii, Strain CS-259" /LENGTH=213 /DNA_ID=CAMNT_0020040223 /DNA_START=55 /DNA_END=696 /DNA_ORIENTATION=-
MKAMRALWICVNLAALAAASTKDNLRSRRQNLRAIEVDTPADAQAGELVDFLAGEVCNMTVAEVVAAPMPLEVFVPLCVNHSQSLVRQLDRSYTDVKLTQVLEHECWLKETFPASHPGHGFPTNVSCLLFAQKLTEARDLDIVNNTPSGYVNFCKDYYDLTMKGNCTKGPVMLPPTAEAGFNPLWAWLILGIIVAIVAAAFAFAYKGASSAAN